MSLFCLDPQDLITRFVDPPNFELGSGGILRFRNEKDRVVFKS
jgi:hypothetical protein